MPRLACLSLVLVCASAAAQTRPSYAIEGGALVLPVPIAFAAGTDTLKPESAPALEHVSRFLADKPDITLVRIEGHTDSQGADAANQALSERRAMVVARWLVAHGADCKRLLPVGFGETKPIADNATPEGRARNSRTEIRMAALRGKPIGGMPVDGGGKVAGDPCRK